MILLLVNLFEKQPTTWGWKLDKVTLPILRIHSVEL